MCHDTIIQRPAKNATLQKIVLVLSKTKTKKYIVLHLVKNSEVYQRKGSYELVRYK